MSSVDRADPICRDEFPPVCGTRACFGAKQRASYPFVGSDSRAGPVKAITSKKLSPVNRVPSIALPGTRSAGLTLFSCNGKVEV